MRYPELAALNTSATQDLALQIEYKTVFSTLSPAEQQAFPNSPGAFVAKYLLDFFDQMVANRVTAVIKSRVQTAVDNDPVAAATALGIDPTVVVPADLKKA